MGDSRPSSDRRLILLLRGINVGGHRKLPMAKLRELCTSIGLINVTTYVASGNVVADSPLSPAAAADTLADAIAMHCGFRTEVIVRPAVRWQAYAADCPLRELADKHPNRVMLHLANGAPAPETAERLRQLASGGEEVARAEDGLWIFFAEGAARSRLTPANIDRAADRTMTARNWRTVKALAAM